MRVLVAEDERDLNDVLCKKLAAEGYAADGCGDGEQALDYINSADYDAVVLDIMMPLRDGLSVLREMRARGDATPVLLLTARDAIADRVAGLDAGADDYLVKPFSLEELMARIRAMTRKAAGAASSVFSVADLTVDCNAHSAARAGAKIELSAKEFAVLEYLARNAGRVLTREMIEDHVWNFEFEGGSNIVDVYIRYLRKKIDDPYESKLIHTVRGAGYVLKERE